MYDYAFIAGCYCIGGDFFMQNIRRGKSLSLLVILSALAALGIILGKFLAFNVTDFMRFSLENLTILFAGILFGPLPGLAVGAVQDLVGCLAVGYTINPIITVGSALVGFVSGCIYRLMKRCPPWVKISVSTASAHLIGSVLTKTAGLSLFLSLPFGVTLAWRLLNYAIVGAVEALLLCFLLKSKQLLTQISKIVPISHIMSFSSYKEAVAYAKSTSGVFSKPGLERVEALLASLGSPEKSLRAVHVAGTNGKGSFASMLSSVLSASGLRVGSFTSPYLTKMCESIRIDGEPITEEALTELFATLRPIADEMADTPTEFELLTAAAYLTFHRTSVDVAIIECGMGGERDATNVIDEPILSVITGVSVDHTAYLGKTVAEIAQEKAGIIKKGAPVLTGAEDPGALAVIKEKAHVLGAKLILADTHPDVREYSLGGTVFDHPLLSDVTLHLLGTYQPRNASLVIEAANILKSHFPTLTDEAIREGIERAEWQGRFEMLSADPTVIFDGAHNLDGIRSAAESVRAYFDNKVICLTGVLSDKDYTAMADEIASIAEYAVTITPNNPRALRAKEYSEVLAERGVTAVAARSISDGVKEALKLAKNTSLPVICLGSLYLYRDIRSELNHRLTT